VEETRLNSDSGQSFAVSVRMSCIVPEHRAQGKTIFCDAPLICTSLNNLCL
jgi:hypothetical protein